MKRVPRRRAAAAALMAAALLAGAVAAGQASPRLDRAQAARDRLAADACILRAVIIYTDPYIGRGLSNPQVVAAIARMCAGPFRRYSEDLTLDAAEARRLLHDTIEAGLRGQFSDDDGDRLLPRNAR